MIFLSIFKHLLPRARAWRITAEKTLRKFFEGLSDFLAEVRAHIDFIWLDIFPATTRQLDEWDAQFSLPRVDLTEAQRRDRIASAWQALGGQSPRYIQDILQRAGFPVFLHEFWDPDYARYGHYCDDEGAESGEAAIECSGVILKRPQDYLAQYNNTPEAGKGYILVNSYSGALYSIPNSSSTWPYFLYIGGETFGDFAEISILRKNEFETLCKKICPTHLWLGLLIEYT